MRIMLHAGCAERLGPTDQAVLIIQMTRWWFSVTAGWLSQWTQWGLLYVTPLLVLMLSLSVILGRDNRWSLGCILFCQSDVMLSSSLFNNDNVMYLMYQDTLFEK